MGVFAGFGSSGEELVRSADSSLINSFHLQAQPQVSTERGTIAISRGFSQKRCSSIALKAKLLFSRIPCSGTGIYIQANQVGIF